MSTAVLTRPLADHVIGVPRSKPKRVTVPIVRAALEEVAWRYPFRVDIRALAEVPARYVDHGTPACLVAHILERLGYSVGILSALDAEHPVGDFFHTGVRIEEARHPALRRIDDNARALLAWVQAQQDRGRRWGAIVRDAFRAKRLWVRARRDREQRPWLYC